MFAYVQTQRIVDIKYAQVFIYYLCLIKLLEKKATKGPFPIPTAVGCSSWIWAGSRTPGRLGEWDKAQDQAHKGHRGSEWESALVKAMLVDLDLAGSQLGVSKGSWAGLSSRIKLRAGYKVNYNWEKATGREVGWGLRQHVQLGAALAWTEAEISHRSQEAGQGWAEAWLGTGGRHVEESVWPVLGAQRTLTRKPRPFSGFSPVLSFKSREHFLTAQLLGQCSG